MPSTGGPGRRPLKTRGRRWAGALAGRVARAGVRPNQISLFSMVFAAGAGACLVATRGQEGAVAVGLWIGVATGIQLRLLCNMLDGMVAVEGGLRSKSGEIYNELPDRFADVMILAAAGYSHPSPSYLPVLGWIAAVLSVITAYVRALGVAAGASQYFLGPMAKPHRMAVLTAASLVNVVLLGFGGTFSLVPAALWVIVMGCVITILRRTIRIVRELESK
ncbi:MAG TPA: CDP-alcohol phosphatidyltransferase family protein [Verrucomicrobiae bacterium]|nr:CDP-alcohol phosphatidyltransferase family protein [Verrucomicrobiae bacterium]